MDTCEFCGIRSETVRTHGKLFDEDEDEHTICAPCDVERDEMQAVSGMRLP